MLGVWQMRLTSCTVTWANIAPDAMCVGGGKFLFKQCMCGQPKSSHLAL